MDIKSHRHQTIEMGDFREHIFQSQEVKRGTHLLPTIEAIDSAEKKRALMRIRREFEDSWGRLDEIQHNG
jgi:hypothetical protein